MPSFLHTLLSDHTARALCWTLVHSLCQGALAALLAGGVILATRKQSAALRYNLLTPVLVLFVLGSGVTLLTELRIGHSRMQTPAGAFIRDITPILHHAPQIHIPITNPRDTHTFRAVINFADNYLNKHATLFTLMWLACFGVQLL